MKTDGKALEKALVLFKSVLFTVELKAALNVSPTSAGSEVKGSCNNLASEKLGRVLSGSIEALSVGVEGGLTDTRVETLTVRPAVNVGKPRDSPSVSRFVSDATLSVAIWKSREGNCDATLGFVSVASTLLVVETFITKSDKFSLKPDSKTLGLLTPSDDTVEVSTWSGKKFSGGTEDGVPDADF